MTVHDFVDADHCYHCGLRAKNVSVSPAAMPTRYNANPPKIFKPNPAWERGVAGERRADGSFMPYLRGRDPMPIKHYGEHRREVDEQVRNLKTRTKPLPSGLPPKE